MGIYDRDYYQEEERTSLAAGQSMVVKLIFLNAVIFIADALFLEGYLSAHLGLTQQAFREPWKLWELLTYGFVHNPLSITHVLFNMISLFIFGRDIEGIYGQKEFLRLYLTLIVVTGAVWLVAENVARPGENNSVIGASGATTGILILWICHFPTRQILIWGVLPVVGWLFGIIVLVMDIAGATDRSSQTAHVVHLAGAAFAFLYYRTGWNLGRLWPSRWSLSSMKLRPKLKVHDPEADDRELSQQVDAILEKIHREGETSLTKKERKALEAASRRYQQKRK